jgi:hypothetical protein
MKTAQEMKKNELVEEVVALQDYVAQLEETLTYVRDRAPRVVTETVQVQKPGRMDEVLAALKAHGHISVAKLAQIVGINERNISSQLTYLRQGKLGGIKYNICTDSRGYKFISE